MQRLLVMALAAAAAAAGADDRVAAAAQKSVALLQNVAGQWKSPCLSCHHQSMPLLALEAARARGIAVNEAAAQAAAERTFRFLSDVDAAARIEHLIDPALSEGYALLGAHAAGVAPNLSTALYARHIARAQQAGGNWATFDARPPHSAGLFVATAVAARAVGAYLPAAQRPGVLEKAKRWLLSTAPEATEDLTYRLLGLQWTGATEGERSAAARALLTAQRPDGGWAQLPAMQESDAYSTGQALYALRQAGGVGAAEAAFQRGIEWLLKTQAGDGSWHVKSRIQTKAPVSPPYFESGFPYGHDQYLSCAATSWAVMALSEALPAAKTPARPLALKGVAPAVEPWMTAAAFGTTAEVEKLDPAAATPGGTTALMLAADDPAKVRALLAKGAKVRTATKAGYDALMIASLFGGNTETIDVLLRAGASVAPAQRARFGAHALAIALFTGDQAMVRLLLEKGADPNRPFRLLGQFSATPLNVAAQMDQADLIRMLVGGGAKMDVPDDLGMTDLSWAALLHKRDALKALLALGAKANVKDKLGLTPAEHTKGIAYSSPETARLLSAAR